MILSSTDGEFATWRESDRGQKIMLMRKLQKKMA
jgi:hypothetical protein